MQKPKTPAQILRKFAIAFDSVHRPYGGELTCGAIVEKNRLILTAPTVRNEAADDEIGLRFKQLEVELKQAGFAVVTHMEDTEMPQLSRLDRLLGPKETKPPHRICIATDTLFYERALESLTDETAKLKAELHRRESESLSKQLSSIYETLENQLPEHPSKMLAVETIQHMQRMTGKLQELTRNYAKHHGIPEEIMAIGEHTGRARKRSQENAETTR